MNRKRASRQDLNVLDQVLEKTYEKNKVQEKNCAVDDLIRKLYMIVLHLKLSHTNTFSNHSGSADLVEYLEISMRRIEGKTTLINMDLVVVLLYNCLKVMVGFNDIHESILQPLDKLYSFFKMTNPGKLYSWHVLQFFFVIKIVIFQEDVDKQIKMSEVDSKVKMNGVDSKVKMNESDLKVKMREGDLKDALEVSSFVEKFSDFLNMNMDETIVSLNELTRNIIRHKVASLSTIIGVKLGINRFSKNFLEVMHDSPFNNDIQTIKLCFELFESREYEKIENLLPTILSASATKNVKQREVLVAMCSILTGLFLENRS